MFNLLLFVLYALAGALGAWGAFLLGPVALSVFACLNIVLMNLFVTKEIMLGGFVATASDTLGIAAVLALNLLREYYPPGYARKTLYISFAAMGWYVVASMFHLAYIPAPTDAMHTYFMTLLLPMPRILLASLFSYAITDALELWMYGRLKLMTQGRFFVARNYATLALTQLLDTIIFTYGGLGGTVSSCADIIAVSYIIKLLTVALCVPFLALCRRWMPYVPAL